MLVLATQGGFVLFTSFLGSLKRENESMWISIHIVNTAVMWSLVQGHIDKWPPGIGPPTFPRSQMPALPTDPQQPTNVNTVRIICSILSTWFYSLTWSSFTFFFTARLKSLNNLLLLSFGVSSSAGQLKDLMEPRLRRGEAAPVHSCDKNEVYTQKQILGSLGNYNSPFINEGQEKFPQLW